MVVVAAVVAAAAVVEVVAAGVVHVVAEVLSEVGEVRLHEVWDTGDEDIPIDVHHLNPVDMMDMGVMVGISMDKEEGTREIIHARGMVMDILRQANVKVTIHTQPNAPMLVAEMHHRSRGVMVHNHSVIPGDTIATHKQNERDIHLRIEDVLLTKVVQIGINQIAPTTTVGKLVRLFDNYLVSSLVLFLELPH